MEQLLELHLPNILGAEKEAIKKAVTIAEKLGFARDRIEDLKTALAEACINAIEHGNKFDQNKKVRVTLAANNKSLEVIVHDEGEGIDPKKIPTKRVRDDGFPCRRGYGVFLMSNLMNEFYFEKNPGKGNNVKMLMHLNG
ncbi:MAG: ATP-binding protein [Desulfobulbaceae bacterium]|jgi:serine/threonine-protein kinase RsbW|nr:ATP-binding protein [Desulfobulbaceae bacterium]MDH3866400.1 ATP-binding protein [Desulfobulbaceae bacterium]HKJ15381.1 ATP-binding protein [Desulfobulbales bacterium]